jgi:hypothetical protein
MAQQQATEVETLSFDEIMEYMTNKHPSIYQYILNEKEIEGSFKLSEVIANSIPMFLTIRRKLGWAIWPEDLKGPFYNKSLTLLDDTPQLEKVHTFTINELKQLLRYSSGLLAYIAVERFPHIVVDDPEISQDEVKLTRLSILKALLKYRYETSDDFELVHGVTTSTKPSPVVAPKHISGNILERMSEQEIEAWAKGKISA